MAPGGRFQNAKHRIRRAHPLRPLASRSLRTLDHADADELRRYQERRLRMLVAVASRFSPYYREWFAESGIEPSSIRTLDDLSSLPLLTRRDLVDRPEDFRVYPRRVMWTAHSSGTSGAAVTSYRTQGSSVYEMAALERQWGWFGLPDAPRRVILRGSGFASHTGELVKAVPGANQLLVTSFQLTPDTVEEIAEQIIAFGPDAVEGWPSSIALLASLLRDKGIKIDVTGIITSSEVMSPGQRSLMRDVFGGPIIDHYGQTERVAMTGTCEAGGHHVFPDYGIVELLPVGPDRWEIVGTALHNFGFPLLRYRTGDEVGPAAGGPCPCGRAFPLIGDIDGRAEDSFVAADGRPLPLPSTIVDDLTGLREVQIAQLAPGRFEVRAVPGEMFDLDALRERVRHNVDELFGPGQEVAVRVLDALPRPASGKLKTAVVESDQ